jgi:DNA-binding MarR family transcriptional regulator
VSQTAPRAIPELLSEMAGELILERSLSPEQILSKGLPLQDCVLAAELDGRSTLTETCERIGIPIGDATRVVLRLLMRGYIRAP